MDIQNISGADMIPGGLTVNSKVSTENVKVEKQEPHENIPNPEKDKGNLIDTKV
jgi:hypothetical protein